jgi:hypothetical protein
LGEGVRVAVEGREVVAARAGAATAAAALADLDQVSAILGVFVDHPACAGEEVRGALLVDPALEASEGEQAHGDAVSNLALLAESEGGQPATRNAEALGECYEEPIT